MQFTRILSAISKKDVAIAGGKGASLGELMKAGQNVPDGFVILAGAFDYFLDLTELNAEIEAALGEINPGDVHSVDSASEKIRVLIERETIPEEMEREIVLEFKKMKAKKVAVRSSATSEDSSMAAWAGQLESFLNTTEKDLLKNVKKCWSSLFTPRAIYYRFEKKLQKAPVSVAVVIQKMVPADAAGIAFSVHPVTQDENQMIIESVPGLGESIVSGEKTPDSFVVEKDSLKILDKTTRKETRKGALTDEEALWLAEKIMDIEKHYKFPVDVEWARADGRFYIVQARPITTLTPTTGLKFLPYIKNQNWFFGVRAEESLFFFSMKMIGEKKLMKKEYGAEFMEKILAPAKKDYPVRVINLDQAKAFHAHSLDLLLKDPQILTDYVKEDMRLWADIRALCKKVDSIDKFKKIVARYEVYGVHFNIIFSLGMKLTENADKFDKKTIGPILKQHDGWRNSVAFEEEKMGEALYLFLKSFCNKEKIKIKPAELMKYLTEEELLDFVSGNKAVTNLIAKRKKDGYLFLGLRSGAVVVDEKKEIKAVSEYLSELNRKKEETSKDNLIKGDVAYSAGEKLRGEVAVIENFRAFEKKKTDLAGKILVTIQTTPQFIPYLKKVKAIITDEGGITCHAAIVAREMKIPCIVGTKNATQKLKTGDRVELDFDNGIVK
jgi:phosphohistidine swiveling domain-containing protein